MKIEIKKEVPKCCRYCLYFSTLNGIPHCGNSNNEDNQKSKLVLPNSTCCMWFWIDHKYR